MKYTILPNANIKINKICLDTMTFGNQNTEVEAPVPLSFTAAIRSPVAIGAELKAFYFQIKIETLINAKKHTVSYKNILLFLHCLY